MNKTVAEQLRELREAFEQALRDLSSAIYARDTTRARDASIRAHIAARAYRLIKYGWR